MSALGLYQTSMNNFRQGMSDIADAVQRQRLKTLGSAFSQLGSYTPESISMFQEQTGATPQETGVLMQLMSNELKMQDQVDPPERYINPENMQTVVSRRSQGAPQGFMPIDMYEAYNKKQYYDMMGQNSRADASRNQRLEQKDQFDRMLKQREILYENLGFNEFQPLGEQRQAIMESGDTVRIGMLKDFERLDKTILGFGGQTVPQTRKGNANTFKAGDYVPDDSNVIEENGKYYVDMGNGIRREVQKVGSNGASPSGGERNQTNGVPYQGRKSETQPEDNPEKPYRKSLLDDIVEQSGTMPTLNYSPYAPTNVVSKGVINPAANIVNSMLNVPIAAANKLIDTVTGQSREWEAQNANHLIDVLGEVYKNKDYEPKDKYEENLVNEYKSLLSKGLSKESAAKAIGERLVGKRKKAITGNPIPYFQKRETW